MPQWALFHPTLALEPQYSTQNSSPPLLGSPETQNIAPLLTAIPFRGPTRHVYGPVVIDALAASQTSLPWLAAET